MSRQTHFLCHDCHGEHGGEPALSGLPRKLGDDACCFCGRPASYFSFTDTNPKTEWCQTGEAS